MPVNELVGIVQKNAPAMHGDSGMGRQVPKALDTADPVRRDVWLRGGLEVA